MTHASHSDLISVFKSLETQLSLFDWREGEAPAWELTRYALYMAARAALEKSAQPRETAPKIAAPRRRALDRATQRLISQVSLSMRRSPTRGGKCDIALFGHPRRKFEDGVWIDLYADPIAEILSDAYAVRFIEMDWNPHQTPEASRDLRYIDALTRRARQAAKKARAKAPALSPEGIAALEAISARLQAEFGVEFDATSRVQETIYHWRALRNGFTALLKRLCPRAVVLVNSPFQQALTAASRDLGLPSIELQHGSPTEGKLNYDYPAGQQLQTFPDFFFSFGDFWTQDGALPLPPERMPAIGFPYLRDRVQRYPAAADAQRRVLTISQPTCRAELCRATIDLARRSDAETEFVWKNHPAEEGRQDAEAAALQAAGVRILPAGANLYEAIASAGTVLGGYSTALYEAVAFSRRPQIMATGYEGFMSRLVSLDAADAPSSAEQIRRNAAPSRAISEALFASRSDAEILQRFDTAIRAHR